MPAAGVAIALPNPATIPYNASLQRKFLFDNLKSSFFPLYSTFVWENFRYKNGMHPRDRALSCFYYARLGCKKLTKGQRYPDFTNNPQARRHLGHTTLETVKLLPSAHPYLRAGWYGYWYRQYTG